MKGLQKLYSSQMKAGAHANVIAAPVFIFLFRSFQILWVLASGYIMVMLASDLYSTGKPLVVNEEQTSWLGTLGFIVLFLVISLVGLFFVEFGIKMWKKQTTLLKHSIENGDL